jgi:acyl dehydratase
MPVDPNAVGRATDTAPVRWTSKDTIIYALGVGAGAEDAARELAFTTENTTGVEQKVLPTFAVTLMSAAPPPPYGDFDRSKSVHAEQEIVLHAPLPAEGQGLVTTRITGVYDKGSGALVTWGTTITTEDGRPLVEMITGSFVRGEGGFGGDRGVKSTWVVPDRAPDAVVTQATRQDQALIYRLSGDRNPLHSDPAYAQRGGWPKPILHGLCTFGFVGRALLAQVGEDPARLASIKARFSSPVMPGEVLTTSIWREDGRLLFRTAVGDRVVLDAGEAGVRP